MFNTFAWRAIDPGSTMEVTDGRTIEIVDISNHRRFIPGIRDWNKNKNVKKKIINSINSFIHENTTQIKIQLKCKYLFRFSVVGISGFELGLVCASPFVYTRNLMDIVAECKINCRVHYTYLSCDITWKSINIPSSHALIRNICPWRYYIFIWYNPQIVNML